jgi:hypothetical protein
MYDTRQEGGLNENLSRTNRAMGTKPPCAVLQKEAAPDFVVSFTSLPACRAFSFFITLCTPDDALTLYKKPLHISTSDLCVIPVPPCSLRPAASM